MNKKALDVSHLLAENRKFYPSESTRSCAWINERESYHAMYKRSLEESNAFWLEQAAMLDWKKPPSVACQHVWDTVRRTISHTWFEDGKLNVCENCVDRHLEQEKPAIIWQGDNEDEVRSVSYRELYGMVCRFANVLKKHGVAKGDRVCIYMPLVPEAAAAMLACARIGAVHTVVFGGFSAESLTHRINDCGCKLVVTANVTLRGGKAIFLKDVVDMALPHCASVESVIVFKRNDVECPMREGRDFWYHDEMQTAEDVCPCEPMDAEDPLFILYTSGSTGKPKGAVHTQAGYLLFAAMTHRYIFDIHPDDIYWCTADIGWVTGHSYVVYGPLANGATTLMFEGIPTCPDPGRFWHIVDKFRVSKFYTAPTAIRALISHGDTWPQKYSLDSLRILGTVGEPINPEAWMWLYEKVGHGNCPIVDTWWQTETGGIMISPLPGFHTLKPGSAGLPFFGVDPVILRDDGTECGVDQGGSLCIRRPWPGMMRTMWGDHQRFIDTYFSAFANMYFSGDGCRKDAEGDYWLLGRIDDVVNVSGHRLGTAEIESALVSHPAVAEAAVVPIPHEVKGQGLYAYVTLVGTAIETDQLKQELLSHVKSEIGAIAVPEKIQFVKALPKTRSGKIMRRILRCIAEGRKEDLGDVSTLADPSIIEDLIQ